MATTKHVSARKSPALPRSRKSFSLQMELDRATELQDLLVDQQRSRLEALNLSPSLADTLLIDFNVLTGRLIDALVMRGVYEDEVLSLAKG